MLARWMSPTVFGVVVSARMQADLHQPLLRWLVFCYHQTSSQTITVPAVNTDVSNGWADAIQTVDYANITGDVCLEIGATTDTCGRYDIYATDCPSVSTPLTPSFDFTQAIVYDY